MPLAGLFAMPQGHQYGQRTAIAASHVRIRIAPAGRLVTGMTHLERIAGQSLKRRPIADIILVRPGMPEAGHGDRNDIGLDFFEAVIVEPPVAHDPRAEIVDHDIRYGRELLSDGNPTRVGHIDNRTLLAPVQIAGKAAAPRPQIKRIAPLDFNDLGTLVGQDTYRDRPGDHPGEIKNADAFERAPALGGHRATYTASEISSLADSVGGKSSEATIVTVRTRAITPRERPIGMGYTSTRSILTPTKPSTTPRPMRR